MKRVFIICTMASVCLFAHSSEIHEAEKQRSIVELKLKSLKKDSQLDAKKRKVIKTELERLGQETKTLTLNIKTVKNDLKKIAAKQRASVKAIEKIAEELETHIQYYKNAIITYYKSGRTLKPNASTQDLLADYLPFIIDARKQSAETILQKMRELEGLLFLQKKNARAQQKMMNALSDTKKLLRKKTQDSQNLLISINRDLSTQAKRESALQSDLQSLKLRIKTMQMKMENSDFTPMKGKLLWPANGRILRRFGQVRIDGFGDWQGIVISADTGSVIRAVQSGKVAYAGYLLGYGLVIVIAHDPSHATIYGHNQSLSVNTGDFVTARQPIAIAGNTGSLNVTGVYFGLTQNGKPINPSVWLN